MKSFVDAKLRSSLTGFDFYLENNNLIPVIRCIGL
jgi:hypothetical protein